jgi:NAD(P)-dependent dehydrogenase (short-subunit alcohol dehydrogenase family)
MRTLIIGASGELGASIARRLAVAGHQLVLHAFSHSSRLTDLADEIGAMDVLSADVRVESEVNSLMERANSIRGLDGLVYAAGINPTASRISDTAYDDWNQTILVNLTGAFLSLRAAIPILRSSTCGSAVLISSVFGLSSPANRGAYGASKHGLTGLVQSAAREEADKVRINAVCPGPMWSENVRQIFSHHAKSVGISVEEYVKQRRSQIPAGRFLELDECASVVEFLLSPSCRFLTGETIRIAGGEG